MLEADTDKAPAIFEFDQYIWMGTANDEYGWIEPRQLKILFEDDGDSNGDHYIDGIGGEDDKPIDNGDEVPAQILDGAAVEIKRGLYAIK